MAQSREHDTHHDPRAMRSIQIGAEKLAGLLGVPPAAQGLVIFAHGSGSGRLSPRNQRVAAALGEAGFATLLMDLLTPAEERERANVFDIELIAERLAETAEWAAGQPEIGSLPVGYFGASTGAGAALLAASRGESRAVQAIVSRGGRPDLAASALGAVRVPTLLIVGGLDTAVIEFNQYALARLQCPKQLSIVPGATHLFEEPGTLEQVAVLAIDWFKRHL